MFCISENSSLVLPVFELKTVHKEKSVYVNVPASQCLELRTWIEFDNEIQPNPSELVVKHLAKLERIRI